MILIDTSALVDSLCGSKRSAATLRSLIDSGERIILSSIVLYEWLRGPRLQEELTAQDELFPSGDAVAFGAVEAAVAADLYRRVRSPRGREIDLAIAAVAIVREAGLWSLNRSDFEDVPGIALL